jgi:purine-nucleoside phosphorylase
MIRRGAFQPLPADPLATAALLREFTPLRPRVAIILGSGFQEAAVRLRVESTIPFARLPGFPRPGVEGHKGEVLAGYFGRTPVLLLRGRAHFYEGHPMEVVTFAVRVLAAFGVRDLLLTNAAGGIHRQFRPGDFMCIKDHINLMGANPLLGARVPGRERFIDLSETYAPELRLLLAAAARKARARLYSGVYLAVSGPSYETPAEIRAFARLGADAVGMSTVPEAVVARQCGLRVAGLSCITNLAAGRARGALSHKDVLETAARVRQTAAALIENFVKLHAETD